MSITALLALAADSAQPSKTAFYIAGGALAVWALVLSLIGLARPDFPSSESSTRGLYGLSALLVLAAAAGAIITG